MAAARLPRIKAPPSVISREQRRNRCVDSVPTVNLADDAVVDCATWHCFRNIALVARPLCPGRRLRRYASPCLDASTRPAATRTDAGSRIAHRRGPIAKLPLEVAARVALTARRRTNPGRACQRGRASSTSRVAAPARRFVPGTRTIRPRNAFPGLRTGVAFAIPVAAHAGRGVNARVASIARLYACNTRRPIARSGRVDVAPGIGSWVSRGRRRRTRGSSGPELGGSSGNSG